MKLVPGGRDEPGCGGLALTVAVPMFNEQQRIKTSLPSIAGWLRGWRSASELIAVDDGSTDGTATLADRLLCQAVGGHLVLTRLLRHERNQGKGAAIRTAFAEARGRCVLLCDADESTPVAEVEKLFAEAERTGAGLAIGSRAVAGAEVEARPHRVILGRIFQAYTRLLGLPAVADSQCGFKLYDRALAQKIAAEGRENGYLADIEHLLIAGRCGAGFVEAGVKWRHRPGSKVRLFRDGLAMIAGAWRLAHQKDAER